MGQFDTQLSPEAKKKYRKWMQDIGHTKEKGMAVDDESNGTDYDYRGWFLKNGAQLKAKGEHFNDEFKKPNHPSFSTESKYSKLGTAMQGGVWQGDKFTPSTLNMLVSSLLKRKVK